MRCPTNILEQLWFMTVKETVGEHHKPIIILNYLGFYEGLKAEAKHMKDLQFLPEQEAYKPLFVNSLEEVYESLKSIIIKS